MSNDFDVVLTCKDRSTKNLRIYGQRIPNEGDVIALPVDGQLIKVQIGELHQDQKFRTPPTKSLPLRFNAHARA
jgi:hypothetical protein